MASQAHSSPQTQVEELRLPLSLARWLLLPEKRDSMVISSASTPGLPLWAAALTPPLSPELTPDLAKPIPDQGQSSQLTTSHEPEKEPGLVHSGWERLGLPVKGRGNRVGTSMVQIHESHNEDKVDTLEGRALGPWLYK